MREHFDEDAAGIISVLTPEHRKFVLARLLHTDGNYNAAVSFVVVFVLVAHELIAAAPSVRSFCWVLIAPATAPAISLAVAGPDFPSAIGLNERVVREDSLHEIRIAIERFEEDAVEGNVPDRVDVRNPKKLAIVCRLEGESFCELLKREAVSPTLGLVNQLLVETARFPAHGDVDSACGLEAGLSVLHRQLECQFKVASLNLRLRAIDILQKRERILDFFGCGRAEQNGLIQPFDFLLARHIRSGHDQR